jgi:DNA repair exonuclease SbcCD nuclease subunit
MMRFLKTTNRVNSPKLLLNNYENFTIIEEPTNVILGGKNVALVPWTPKEEMVNTLNFLSSSDAKYGFGHMQIQSFAMYKGAENEDGMPVDIFNNFKRFFTGHFHHKSDNGKIFYLGAPYEITWSDYDDPKGFHVFDFDADELTFIENPYRMFYKFFYNDLNKEPVIPEDVLKRLGGKYVKVVVQSKNNINHFDNYMSLIDDQGPTDLIVMDEYLSVDNITSDTSIENIEDTLALLRESINKAEASVPVNKEELIRLFTELFAEANALE